MDKAEMNRRGLANMQKAKQRHLDRIANQQGRPKTTYNTHSKTYAQRAEEARKAGIRERNRVRAITKVHTEKKSTVKLSSLERTQKPLPYHSL